MGLDMFPWGCENGCLPSAIAAIPVHRVSPADFLTEPLKLC